MEPATQPGLVARLDSDDPVPVFSFVDTDPNEDFVCKVCYGPLHRPTQVICNSVDEGHRACGPCLHRLMKNIKRCPSCNQSCDVGAIDGRLSRQMRTVDVSCDSCDWRGQWQDHEKHLTECAAVGESIGWRCPVEACGFRATSHRAVEIHMLNSYMEHLHLLPRPEEPIPAGRTLTTSAKDFAQVYIPSVREYMAAGELINSPMFIAGDGYMCTLQVKPGPDEIVAGLALLRSQSGPRVRWPFDRPFMVCFVSAQRQCVTHVRNVDFHLTTESRFRDPNICPAETSTMWTAGLTCSFSRAQWESLQSSDAFVKIFVL
eukprot:TRINITY_DN104454_c0_g1_i1.p1 TRINITY_DN104454_c0_g1~~TRINITY_DN104454_c0_g1_i1.p1  ORF type:complete len:317 (-),score=0.65 TRINITY_DN104454_c0_g1_i1:30-980(-)